MQAYSQAPRAARSHLCGEERAWAALEGLRCCASPSLSSRLLAKTANASAQEVSLGEDRREGQKREGKEGREGFGANGWLTLSSLVRLSPLPPPHGVVSVVFVIERRSHVVVVVVLVPPRIGTPPPVTYLNSTASRSCKSGYSFPCRVEDLCGGAKEGVFVRFA